MPEQTKTVTQPQESTSMVLFTARAHGAKYQIAVTSRDVAIATILRGYQIAAHDDKARKDAFK